jgi:hypothetical protein
VNWEETTLPTRTEPGYGERALPATELITSLGGEARPLCVWFYSLEDERENRTLETSIFNNESVALSLRMYRTVKIDVESIKDGKLREEYGQTPLFVVIDPLKVELSRIAGKRAVSVSRFKGFVAKSWASLFEMRQRDFLKQMTKILDRLDRVSGQLTVLRAKKARLARKPNPAKARALAKEEEKLNQEQAQIEADEEEIKKRCVLKKKYREQDEPEK